MSYDTKSGQWKCDCGAGDHYSCLCPAPTSAVFELVLPARFAEYVSGCNLLETKDPSRDSDGDAVLAAWAKATTRRGQTVIPINMDEDGRLVTGFFFDYADTVVTGGTEDFTRNEVIAARKVVDRIVAIRRNYREVVRNRKQS